MPLFIQYFFMVLKSGPLKNNLKKLAAFEMRRYRKVLNLNWNDKIRNEDVHLRISSCKFNPRWSLLASMNHSCPGLVMYAEWVTCVFPNAFLWKWSLVPTDKEDQGRDRKMISLLAAPSSKLIGMLRLGTEGLI